MARVKMKAPGLLGFILIGIILPAWSQDWDHANRAALSLYQQGQYIASITVARQALELAQQEYGIPSSAYLTSLSNLAYAQSGAGNLDQALNNFRRAAAMSFRLYTLPHVDQIEALTELSKTFMKLAVYDSAEYYLNLARSVCQQLPEQNKAHYDTSLYLFTSAFIKVNSLDASLSYRKGQINKAIGLLQAQLSFIKQLYPEAYATLDDYRSTVNNLSTYFNDVQDYEKAKTYALEYNRLMAESGTPPDRIRSLQNLGSIYSNMGKYDSAAVFWKTALQQIRSWGLQNNYLHMVILNNLGELYLNTSSYDSAIFCLRKSLTIQNKQESRQPALYQTTLYNLAEGYHWAGNYAAADSVYADLIDGLLNAIVHDFTYLSDDEKLSFYKSQVDILDSYKTFVLEVTGMLPTQKTSTPYLDKELAGRLYDVQLTTKALILHASKRMKANILTSGDSTLIRNYLLWEGRKNQLANALLNDNLSGAELQLLRETIEQNEKWLTVNSRSFESGFETRVVSWKEVQQTLKPGEAAVEFVRVVDGLLYLALILTPDTHVRPAVVLIQSTRSKHLDDQYYHNYYNSLQYRTGDTLSYSVYWQPVIDTIVAHMPGERMPKKIYVSNDGIYNQINLSTLQNPHSGKYVIDETDIVILTNTKELLSPPGHLSKMSKTAALFGEPDFSYNSGISTPIADLPGTGIEVKLIDQTLTAAGWHTDLYTAHKATEQQVKKLKNPAVLHLATHGYFDAGESGGDASLAATMIRSGIVLAAAADSTHREDDGLLTAYEMSALNLDSTQLVVLSACETARGVDNHGEGVYGIQRALRVAGVHNMIMSLWKVDDSATQELMVDFYRRWVSTNDIRASFRSAQQSLRKKHPEAYYWGAFILGGK